MFTQSGATARKFEKVVEAGQIGVNAPIPVPLPMFAWSGNKGSVLGGASLYGQRGLDFWTQLKVSSLSSLTARVDADVFLPSQTTTSLWRAEDAIDSKATTAMPTQN